MKKILVSDLTLKKEAEKGTLSFRKKMNIAKALDELKVNVIELPAIKNIKEDTIINETISSAVKFSAVKIEAGTTKSSIEDAWESIKSAKKPCLKISLPVSTVGMEYNFHKKAPKMEEMVKELVADAKSKCERVEFCALDATRAEKSFLVSVCKSASESGACCITLCDDACVALPNEFAEMVNEVKAQCEAKIFVQPSDKLQMAAATVAQSVQLGADGVKTSLSDDEILSTDVFAEILRIKGEDLKIEADINISEASSKAKSIKSGDMETSFESSNSADVQAFTADSSLKDACDCIAELGYELEPEDCGKVYNELQRVVSKKNSVGIKEFEAIIASTAMQVPSTYHLESYVINNGNIITSTSNIVLIKDDEKLSGVSTGDGPVDASFQAIEQIVGCHYELDDFQIQALTQGRDSVGSALVKLRADGKLYSGNGVSTDIIGASVRAYLNALNKIVYEEN